MNKRNNPSVAFSLHTKISFKIILVGEKGAGKTSFIYRYIKGNFDNKSKVTIGVQFYSKTAQVKGQQVLLQIWDTAGSQEYKAIARSFYKAASCIIIAYCSFDQMQKKIQDQIYQVNENASQHAKICLIRTKIDISPVSLQQRNLAKILVQKYQMSVFEQVSSKQNINVAQFFNFLLLKLYKAYEEQEQFKQIVDPKQDSFILNSPRKNKKDKTKKCC